MYVYDSLFLVSLIHRRSYTHSYMSGFMALELGLTLPDQSTPMVFKGLDLMNCSNKGLEMGKNKAPKGYQQKRGFLDDHHAIDQVESKGLSLLLWSGQPNEDDYGRRPQKWGKLHVNDEKSEEENQEIVGWPPISSFRKELLRRRQGGLMGYHRAAAVEQIAAVRNSRYVKVKMEGVAFGRKINLRLYDSYEALTNTLINMFAKYRKIDRNLRGYTILYQDKEGDWMLLGLEDAPWETFIESVQRVEILKNESKMGLSYIIAT